MAIRCDIDSRLSWSQNVEVRIGEIAISQLGNNIINVNAVCDENLAIPTVHHVWFNCTPSPLRGRFISFQRIVSGFFDIREVSVFGQNTYPSEVEVPKDPLIASSSSEMDSARTPILIIIKEKQSQFFLHADSASLVVDSSVYDCGNAYHGPTPGTDYNWLQVDMQQTYPVTKVANASNLLSFVKKSYDFLNLTLPHLRFGLTINAVLKIELTIRIWRFVLVIPMQPDLV